LSQRILFAAGPGNIIAAHEHWARGEPDPTEVSVTFSSQMEDYCLYTESPAYFVSYNSPPVKLVDRIFTFEHRPKPWPGSSGLKFHFAEMIYTLGLLMTAVKFRADVAVIDSGTSQFFMGWLFRIAGIRVVTILHNTIWPSGFPPNKSIQKIIQLLDSFFFRWGSTANIAVSPECARQIEQVTRGCHGPIYEIRAQFIADRFATIGPPPPFDGSSLRVMFIGRIDRSKGVFDILEIAKLVEKQLPGKVRWEICGRGPDLELLKQRLEEMQLKNVDIRGWVSIEQLQEVYGRSHISIVPTRSSFAEGLAMTAAEAILAGRPIITNRTVPALEILRPASLEGRTDDPASYVAIIERLMGDPSIYYKLCSECPQLQKQFYDRATGLATALSSAIESMYIPRDSCF
jgi:glycogen synthase